MKNYAPPYADHWQGRKTSNAEGPLYWYQRIQAWNAATEAVPEADFALVGYACDEGVRRNQGRAGAAAGPSAIRQQIGKMAAHFGETTILDAGDAICPNEDLEACRDTFAQLIATLLRKGICPIALGGGHDIAYAHFLGIQAALEGASPTKIGIINFDAHFDLRPVIDQANSGTPFNQILTEYPEVGYLAIGIQRAANTTTLFDVAAAKGVQYILAEDCRTITVPEALIQFTDQYDFLFLTIDLDGFASPYAPGVSAPSPMGMTPAFVEGCLRYLLATQKVRTCEVSELNPRYDQDHATARLAARLVDMLVGKD
ncbi:MAG: formimidoylglutamase [Bacteroidota bacterium]